MMKTGNRHTLLLTLLAAVAIVMSLGGPVFAVDDGARAYWKGRDGTSGVSVQYLRLDMNSSGSEQFAPDQYIYPNADVEGNIFIVTYARHMTLFNRPSVLSFNLAGGNIDLDIDVDLSSPEFLPPGATPGTSFSESSSGIADPSVQLVVNLFGTPPLIAGYDLLNYEPTWTLDTALMLAIPIGEYDDDKLVNMGLNRWYGRLAFPFKYHFGPFTPGYMTSLEIVPSVWLFDDNDDFLGQDLENDPMWQLEAHLTHDLTPSFWGSLDLLYRGGFESEIDGANVGDALDIGNLGLTFNYQVNDNFSIRTGYSTNVFGDDDLDNSLIRIQFVYGWHAAMENIKKLMGGH